MKILAVELTLDKVIQTCRQVELTKAQIDTLSENAVVPKTDVRIDWLSREVSLL